jgi:hypothetical protein
MLRDAINSLVKAGFLLPFDAERALNKNLKAVTSNSLLSQK